jgi:hypothetical protein
MENPVFPRKLGTGSYKKDDFPMAKNRKISQERPLPLTPPAYGALPVLKGQILGGMGHGVAGHDAFPDSFAGAGPP